ncbi:hypothetical protein [Streptomyces spiralis]|uniref:hypothetical protein n=1 Tax=Streptomyces spiralis TaxID=66376 RepID=UPI0036909F7F
MSSAVTSRRSAAGSVAVVGFTGDAALAAGDRFDILAPGRLNRPGGAVTAVLKKVRPARYAVVRALLPAISRHEPEHPGAASAW